MAPHRTIQEMIDNPVSAFELFPGLEEDITRRIGHSETRIKNWIISGILANLVILIGIGAPLIYYLGTMQAQATTAMAQVAKITATLDQRSGWMTEREMWEIRAEAAMEAKGISIPSRTTYQLRRDR